MTALGAAQPRNLRKFWPWESCGGFRSKNCVSMVHWSTCLAGLLVVAASDVNVAPSSETFFSTCTRDTEMLCADNNVSSLLASKHPGAECLPCPENAAECTFCSIEPHWNHFTFAIVSAQILLFLSFFFIPGCCIFYCGRFCCRCFGGRWPNRNVCCDDSAVGFGALPGRSYTKNEIMCARGCGVGVPVIIILAAIGLIVAGWQVGRLYGDAFDTTLDLLRKIDSDLLELRADLMTTSERVPLLAGKFNSSDFKIADALQWVDNAKRNVSTFRSSKDGGKLSTALNVFAQPAMWLGGALVLVALPGAILAGVGYRKVLTLVIPIFAAMVLYNAALYGAVATPLSSVVGQSCGAINDFLVPPTGYVSPLDGLRTAWESLSTSSMAFVDVGAVPSLAYATYCEVHESICETSTRSVTCTPSTCTVPPNPVANTTLKVVKGFSFTVDGKSATFAECKDKKGPCACDDLSGSAYDHCESTVALSQQMADLPVVWEAVRNLVKKWVAPGAKWSWDGMVGNLQPLLGVCSRFSVSVTSVAVAAWIASIAGVAYLIILWMGNKRFAQPHVFYGADGSEKSDGGAAATVGMAGLFDAHDHGKAVDMLIED